ncbi:MAG: gliding motility-associated C-terminal domain-containing protein [Flavobacteriales bacterium]|nr:gliding motility-associated C-terminal domain-containing protein [Flavobacteriales bacterium]
MCGVTSDGTGSSIWNGSVMRFDTYGTLLWSKSYGGYTYDEAYGIMVGDDGIWVLMEPESYGTYHKAGLLHLNLEGNPLLFRLYSEEDVSTFPDAFTRTANGGFAIFGTIGGWAAMSRLWFVTTDDEANAPCAQWDVDPQVWTHIYPEAGGCTIIEGSIETPHLITASEHLWDEVLQCYSWLEEEDNGGADVPMWPGSTEEGQAETEPDNDEPVWPAVDPETPVLDIADLYIPNSFTPNGDHLNDIWAPSVPQGWMLELQVYNRWGILVFETANYPWQWNGFWNENTVSEIFTYVARYRAPDGFPQVRYGTVALIR